MLEAAIPNSIRITPSGKAAHLADYSFWDSIAITGERKSKRKSRWVLDEISGSHFQFKLIVVRTKLVEEIATSFPLYPLIPRGASTEIRSHPLLIENTSHVLHLLLGMEPVQLRNRVDEIAIMKTLLGS